MAAVHGPSAEGLTAMDFDVTRDQWVERFVIRLSNLERGGEPGDFVVRANELWPANGHLAPEVAADAEFAVRQDAAIAARIDFENTQGLHTEGAFERTERIPVERSATAGDYVRDTDEWIARCTARVLELDPIIKSDEARRSVADLAALDRWRLMTPEAAADQLYTPIKPRT